MRIGKYEAARCGRPSASLSGVRHIQTEDGPADLFADVEDRVVYMRVWLNRDGLDEIVWYRLEGTDGATGC